jgi:hypothetical protein
MAHQIVNSTCPVHTGQSGEAAKFPFLNLLLSCFLGGRGAALGLTGPTVRWCTGQSGAPKTETLTFFLLFFETVFILTRECVIE